MVYMFNELSLNKVDSREIACNLLETFVRAYIRAKEIGFEEMRLHEKSLPNLYKIPLHDEYNIDSWLKDNRINSDLRDRFREIVTSSPLITEAEIDENDLYSRSEFYKNWNNTICQVWGLGGAFIYRTLSISMNTRKEWEEKEISISHYYLDENIQEVNKEVIVRHFSTAENLNNHLDWWTNFQLQNLQTSAEVWKKRKELFHNLELCGDVEKQLEKIGVSKTLSQIIDRLKSLDKYLEDWDSGDFNYEDANNNTNLRISPESDTTLRKFGSLRKFSIPNQGKKLCDLHIKTGDLRFHFYPDNIERKIYVAYIGKHLRVTSEN